MYFSLSTNTTQHLHIHKFLITGAQILFYKSQIKKLTRSHFCSTCCIFGAKHVCAPVTDNVNLWTKFEYVQIWMWTCTINVQCMSNNLSRKYICSFKTQTQIDKYKCANLPHESQIPFPSTTNHESRLHWDMWCKTICAFSLLCKRGVLNWDWLIPQPIREGWT